MSELTALERALASIARALDARKRPFALIGGLAVSIRAEVRFTRDVDLAVAVADDADAERLVLDLRADGYRAMVSVEHETQKRLSTIRLASPEGVKVDLLFASSGIEAEITSRAIRESLPSGELPVARCEELLALKVLSMGDDRLQDRVDGQRLLTLGRDLDLSVVRANLALITERGFHRNQDLPAKLASLQKEVQ